MTKTILTIIAALMATSAVGQTPIASDFPNGSAAPKAKVKYERPARTEYTVDTTYPTNWTFPPAPWIMDAIKAGVPINIGTKNSKTVCERAPWQYQSLWDKREFDPTEIPRIEECVEAQAYAINNAGFNDQTDFNWSDARKSCTLKIALRNSRDGFTDWANTVAEAHLCKTEKRIAEVDVKLAAIPVKFTEMKWFRPCTYQCGGPATETNTIVNVGNRTYVVSTVGNTTTVRSSSDK